LVFKEIKNKNNTVKREVKEKLGIEASFLMNDPFFLTITETVGQTAGHTENSPSNRAVF
jgi:hypothetical protein